MGWVPGLRMAHAVAVSVALGLARGPTGARGRMATSTLVFRCGKTGNPASRRARGAPVPDNEEGVNKRMSAWGGGDSFGKL